MKINILMAQIYTKGRLLGRTREIYTSWYPIQLPLKVHTIFPSHLRKIGFVSSSSDLLFEAVITFCYHLKCLLANALQDIQTSGHQVLALVITNKGVHCKYTQLHTGSYISVSYSLSRVNVKPILPHPNQGVCSNVHIYREMAKRVKCIHFN